MYICKKCGDEVVEWEPVIVKRRILNQDFSEPKRAFLHEDDTMPITYHCEKCGAKTKADSKRALLKIAKWESRPEDEERE